MCVGLPDIRGPELILRRRHLCPSSPGEKGTYLFGEPFIEGIQREVLRDPRLGMALVTGVHAILFTTLLHEYSLNLNERDTGRQDLTSAIKTLRLGYK